MQKGYQVEVTQIESTIISKVTVDSIPICTFLRYEVILKEKILEEVHFLWNPEHSEKGLQFQNELKVQWHIQSSHPVGTGLKVFFWGGFHSAVIQRSAFKDVFWGRDSLITKQNKIKQNNLSLQWYKKKKILWDNLQLNKQLEAKRKIQTHFKKTPHTHFSF